MFNAEGANCTQTDPELFFPESEKKIKPKHMNLVVEICASCPIYVSCYKYALEHDVQGLWAGTTYAERRQIRRREGIKAEVMTNSIYFESMSKDAIQMRKWREQQEQEKEG